MSKIIGNTTATPVPRSDWNQTDATKADFILNKPDVATKADVNNAINALGNTYYTETEIDSKVATLNSAIDGKSDSGHDHDGSYYTETEVDAKIESVNAIVTQKTQVQIVKWGADD